MKDAFNFAVGVGGIVSLIGVICTDVTMIDALLSNNPNFMNAAGQAFIWNIVFVIFLTVTFFQRHVVNSK